MCLAFESDFGTNITFQMPDAIMRKYMFSGFHFRRLLFLQTSTYSLTYHVQYFSNQIVEVIPLSQLSIMGGINVALSAAVFLVYDCLLVKTVEIVH